MKGLTNITRWVHVKSQTNNTKCEWNEAYSDTLNVVKAARDNKWDEMKEMNEIEKPRQEPDESTHRV
jgi:hypothetical protein